jgi:uncharacterized protein (DUF779 family)
MEEEKRRQFEEAVVSEEALKEAEKYFHHDGGCGDVTHSPLCSHRSDHDPGIERNPCHVRSLPFFPGLSFLQAI